MKTTTGKLKGDTSPLFYQALYIRKFLPLTTALYLLVPGLVDVVAAGLKYAELVCYPLVDICWSLLRNGFIDLNQSVVNEQLIYLTSQL